MKNIISNLINISKEIEKQCHTYSIKFIDTSNFNNIRNYFL